MAKSKPRFREPILTILRSVNEPVPYSELLFAILGQQKQNNPQDKRRKITFHHSENALGAELRQLVKERHIIRLPGNKFSLRSAKTPQNAPKGTHKSTDSEQGSKNKHRTYEGTVSKNSRGFAFVKLSAPPENITEDVFLSPQEAESLVSGDRITLSLERSRPSDKGPSGQLVKILERRLEQIVGEYHAHPARPYVSVSTKDIEMNIYIEKEAAFKELKDGAAVLVTITQHPNGREPAKGKILSVLADSLDSTTDDAHIIAKHKLRTFFAEEVILESDKVPQAITPAECKNRTDLRALPFVTIDGSDSRDFDDAVCAKDLGGGHFKLWVAVADVAHYVRLGSALDKEAYARGTSVYFPHRVLPMLPERLSNGICSLNPAEDRLVMVCEMDFDAEGVKTAHKVYEAVFQSHKRCVYEELQKYYDKPVQYGAEYSAEVRKSLQALFTLYKLVQKQRFARGAIDLELPESKVVIGKKGEVLEIKHLERKDTHRLIEEFMIAANEGVSEIMEEAKLEFLFRVHETPEPQAFQRFLELSKSFGIVPPKISSAKEGQAITPRLYQSLASSIKTTAAARVLHFQLLRSMKQAFYTHDNLQHFGLASEAYTHFTSPIRRYPDLIVHRLLKAYLRKDSVAAKKAHGSAAESLPEAAQYCSQRERAATDAEREMIRMKQVRYAEAHLGESFMGIIVGVTGRGLFVELQGQGVEGFVSSERLHAGARFDEKSMTLKIPGSNQIYRLGDSLGVTIARTNPHLLQVDLEPDAVKSIKPTKSQQAPQAERRQQPQQAQRPQRPQPNIEVPAARSGPKKTPTMEMEREFTTPSVSTAAASSQKPKRDLKRRK